MLLIWTILLSDKYKEVALYQLMAIGTLKRPQYCKLIRQLLPTNEIVHSAKKLIVLSGSMAAYDVNEAIELLFDDESGLSGSEK